MMVKGYTKGEVLLIAWGGSIKRQFALDVFPSQPTWQGSDPCATLSMDVSLTKFPNVPKRTCHLFYFVLFYLV